MGFWFWLFVEIGLGFIFHGLNVKSSFYIFQNVSELLKWHARLDLLGKERRSRFPQQGTLGFFMPIFVACKFFIHGKATDKKNKKEKERQPKNYFLKQEGPVLIECHLFPYLGMFMGWADHI